MIAESMTGTRLRRTDPRWETMTWAAIVFGVVGVGVCIAATIVDLAAYAAVRPGSTAPLSDRVHLAATAHTLLVIVRYLVLVYAGADFAWTSMTRRILVRARLDFAPVVNHPSMRVCSYAFLGYFAALSVIDRYYRDGTVRTANTAVKYVILCLPIVPAGGGVVFVIAMLAARARMHRLPMAVRPAKRQPELATWLHDRPAVSSPTAEADDL